MIPNKTFDIINNIIPMVLLFAVVTILLRVVIAIYTNSKISFYKETKLLVYVLYLFVLFQLVTTTDYGSYGYNNFIPFKEIMRYDIAAPLFWRNVVGNIVVFAPFGYIITDIIYMFTKRMNVFISFGFTVLMSSSIEFIQMFIGRSFDIDDIILNSLGGLIGFIAFVIMKKIFKEDNFITNTVKAFLFLVVVIAVCLFVYFAIK
jgi:glycopeptide antibiotics resistance protein